MADDRNIIQERMLSNIDDSYDKSEGSFFYDALKPVAIELENTDKKIDETKSKLSIENLSGDELAQTVKDRSGIEKKLATKATGYVTIIGSEGAQITNGDLVASDTLNFIVKETLAINETGEEQVLVECELEGSIGNVPVGAIRYFPITLAGITSVTNEQSFTNGYNDESDKDLLQRYYEKMQTPATSGNKYHYKNWAKEVAGVGDAKVFSLWNGDNTVKVVIIDADKQPASQWLVDEVQEYIDPGATGLGNGEAPIGAYCTVTSAIGKSIVVSFNATLATGYDAETAEQVVENALIEYYKSIAFKEDQTTGEPKHVSYAIIGATIIGTAAIVDYTNLTINDSTSNIIIGSDEVPVSGGVTIA